jgi:hypothetical protein
MCRILHCDPRALESEFPGTLKLPLMVPCRLLLWKDCWSRAEQVGEDCVHNTIANECLLLVDNTLLLLGSVFNFGAPGRHLSDVSEGR